MSIFGLLSKSAKIKTVGSIIEMICITNSEFSFDIRVLSTKNNLIERISITKRLTPVNHEVNHGIPSLQLIELKTSTYQNIVNNKGIA